MSCIRCEVAGQREGVCDGCIDRDRHEAMERGGPVAVVQAKPVVYPKFPAEMYRIAFISGIIGLDEKGMRVLGTNITRGLDYGGEGPYIRGIG